MSTDNRYYVYIHRKLATGLPFYVGKGSGKRAFERYNHKRTKRWHSVVLKYGYTVEIYKDCLSEKDALSLESELIKKLKHFGIPLCNFLENGYVSGMKLGSSTITEESKNKISKSLKEFYKYRDGPRKNAKGLAYYKNGHCDLAAWLNLDLFWEYKNILNISYSTLSHVFPEISKTTFITIVDYLDKFGNPNNDKEWVNFKSSNQIIKLKENPFACSKYNSKNIVPYIEIIESLVKQGMGCKKIYKMMPIFDSPSSLITVVKDIRSGWNYKEDLSFKFMFERYSQLVGE